MTSTGSISFYLLRITRPLRQFRVPHGYQEPVWGRWRVGLPGVQQERARNILITEFSPVWHHYAYKEKPSFVYKDDYNIDVPLEVSLDLEKIMIRSIRRRVSCLKN